MIKVHKEGYKIIAVSGLFLLLLAVLSTLFLIEKLWIWLPILVFIILLFLFLMNFFRVPVRTTNFREGVIYSPADGRIVAIEEIYEAEFLNEKRIQISIFMSVWDVHINYYPIRGSVDQFIYHPGKFLIARHPKSSVLNERTSILIESDNNIRILIRQIAGIVARRIVCYARAREKFNTGDELGFIKFGSRVDVFLPLTSTIHVKLNDRVLGSKTPLASI